MRLRNWSFCVGLLSWWLAAPAAAQETIRWEVSLETARRLAFQENRMVLVHFWADWCQRCGQMEQEVFSRPEVVAAVEAGFIPVKLHADDAAHIARHYGVSVLPCDVIISPEGRLVDKIVKVAHPTEYAVRLNRVAGKAPGRVAARYGDPPLGRRSATQEPGPPRLDRPSYEGANQGRFGITAPSDAQYAAPSTRQQGSGLALEGPPAGFGGAMGLSQGPPRPDLRPSAQSALDRSAQFPGVTGAQPVQPGPEYGRVYPRRSGAELPALARGDSPLPTDASPVQPPAPRIQLPPGVPPLGLDGYCPVQLTENERWVPGDPRWGLTHRGRTYLFSGPEQRDRCLADPDRYTPVLSGRDVVLLVEQGRMVPGRREDGVWYRDTHGGQFERRVYLFSSRATRDKFTVNPGRYVDAVQRWTPTVARVPAARPPGVSRAPWDLLKASPR